MRVTVIHASHGRPVLAMSTMKKWIDKSSGENEIEYLLSVDKADKSDYPDYISFNAPHVKPKVIRNDTSTSVAAINNAAEKSTGQIIVVTSDDFDCPQDWDKLIVTETAGKHDWILKTQDGTQPWIITLPIMDRVYYERFGYVYFYKYAHMFCDTEMSAVADLLGKRIVSDIVFQHNHYSTKNGIAKDKTSQKADATWNVGESLFMQRAKNNFGIEFPLPCDELQKTIDWINKKNGVKL